MSWALHCRISAGTFSYRCQVITHGKNERKKGSSIKEHQYFTNSTTGDRFVLDASTGEVHGTRLVEIPDNAVSFYYETEDDLEEKKRRARAIADREQREYYQKKRKKASDELTGDGGFFFVAKGEQFAGVKPETVTKLILLSTYLGFDKNRLMLTQRIPLMRCHLREVLGVSPATVSRFLQETSDYIAELEDKSLVLKNTDVIVRGKIKNKQHAKFYIDGVRALYEKAEKKDHGRIGCLFKLLPFVNIEWNLLCYPEYALERNLERIELITISEFCEWINFDVNHIGNLLDSYRNIRFNVGGRMERFCSIDYDGIDRNNAKIIINPRILYSGSDYKKVEALGALCR